MPEIVQSAYAFLIANIMTFGFIFVVLAIFMFMVVPLVKRRKTESDPRQSHPKSELEKTTDEDVRKARSS